jgi:hypothetical protein
VRSGAPTPPFSALRSRCATSQTLQAVIAHRYDVLQQRYRALVD